MWCDVLYSQYTYLGDLSLENNLIHGEYAQFHGGYLKICQFCGEKIMKKLQKFFTGCRPLFDSVSSDTLATLVASVCCVSNKYVTLANH